MAVPRWRDVAIGFSMATTSLTVVLPDLVANAVISGNVSSLLFLWTGAFAVATSLVFFAPLWPKVPVSTENEFLLFRYSGISAQVVYHFRSLLMGIIIIPLMASWLLVGVEQQLQTLIGWEENITTISIIAVVAFLLPFNSLLQRILQDAYSQVVVLGTLAMAGIWLLYQYPCQQTSMQLAMHKMDMQIFDKAWVTHKDVLFYLLFYWWMAFIPDLPDINGQKLMRYSDTRRALFSFGLARIPYLFMQFTLIYLAVVSAAHTSPAKVGSPVMSFLMRQENTPLRWMMLVVWGSTAVAVLMNHFRWAEDLLNPFRDSKRWGVKRLLATLAPFCMTFYFWKSASDVKTAMEWFFTLGIGVGPVFFLRWFWWRINGWVQFSAMVAALLYAPLYYWLFQHVDVIHGWIQQGEAYTGLSSANFRHGICGLCVTVTWLLVMRFTRPDSTDVLDRFYGVVKPGGWWKKDSVGVSLLLRQFLPMILIGCFILGLSCSFLCIAIAKLFLGMLIMIGSFSAGVLGWILLKKQQARC